MTVTNATGLALLRAPFPAHQISKLPKESGAQAKSRKADQDNGKWPAQCQICGGYHHPKAVHLDYVGHAALTDRLLDADPNWVWEPVAFGPDGNPAFDKTGGLWIRLTVCGVTRLGYGAADGKTGGDAIKEMIGDALRNAAMRFGAALDLWHKGDLHMDDTPEPKPEPKVETGPRISATGSETSLVPPDRMAILDDVAQAIEDRMKETDLIGAYEEYIGITDDGEKVALWGMLHSATRSALKKHGAEVKAKLIQSKGQ